MTVQPLARFPEALAELHEDINEATSATLGEVRRMLDSVIDLDSPDDMTDAGLLILGFRMVLGIELADRDRAFDAIVEGIEGDA